MMLKHLAIAAGIVAATAVSTSAQQAGQTALQPDPKAEKKEAPSIVGKWNLSVETQQGAMASVLTMKLDGKKVTGTVSGQNGELPIEGEWTDNKLTFSLTFQGGGGSMQIGFAGAFKEDGTLAGTMDIGGQPSTWKAERIKEK